MKKIIKLITAISMIAVMAVSPVFAEGEEEDTEPVVTEQEEVTEGEETPEETGEETPEETEEEGTTEETPSENEDTDEEGAADEADISTTSLEEEGNEPVSQEVNSNLISNEEELIAAFEKGGSYVLSASFELTGTVDVQTDVELDLGGYTITFSSWGDMIDIFNGGNLTIGGEGSFVQTFITPETDKADEDGWMFNVYAGSNLTINGGKYESMSEGNVKNGNMLFYITGEDASLVINGGEFSNNHGYMVYLYKYSHTYINGGTFTGANGIAMMDTSAGDSTDHRLDDDHYNSPVVLVWGQENAAEGPKMHVTGAAIYGNYWYSPTDITINSGEVISENSTAIYHPQQGTFTMNGGLLMGGSGIDAKMGTFTFNGGYVVGTGAKRVNNADDISGQSEAEGSPLVFETEYYGTDNENHGDSYYPDNGFGHYPKNNNLSVTINDGVFISNNNSAITVYEWNWCEQNVNFDINGGRFSSFPETIVVKWTEGDGYYYGTPTCNTLDYTYNYLKSTDGSVWAPAAYYDGVDLKYGYTGEDAPFYASMADAVADRNNDPDARAYIYYLLDNGLSDTGSITRQLQIFYDLSKYCSQYIPENLNMGEENAVFGYSFAPSKVEYNTNQYVLTDDGSYALWSPAVTYDANGGAFKDGSTETTVLATVASGLFTGDGYGYVVDSQGSYVTFDEKGTGLDTPASTVLVNPADPTWGSKTFLGWYYADGTKFDPATTQIKANLTVYAKWQAEAVNTPEDPVLPTLSFEVVNTGVKARE